MHSVHTNTNPKVEPTMSKAVVACLPGSMLPVWKPRGMPTMDLLLRVKNVINETNQQYSKPLEGSEYVHFLTDVVGGNYEQGQEPESGQGEEESKNLAFKKHFKNLYSELHAKDRHYFESKPNYPMYDVKDSRNYLQYNHQHNVKDTSKKHRTWNQVNKLSHCGVLDREAEGLVVIGINEGVKSASAFLSGNKIYELEGFLGYETDTLDFSGEITFKDEDISSKEISHTDFQNMLDDKFTGKIMQTAPIYSNLKVGKVTQASLIRKGDMVIEKDRPKEIVNMKLLALNWPLFRVEVECEGGTYMRSLARDIGIQLGTRALATEIIRTKYTKTQVDMKAPANGLMMLTIDDLSLTSVHDCILVLKNQVTNASGRSKFL